MDRLEELTGPARLLELRRKMEEVKRSNDAEKRRLTVRISCRGIAEERALTAHVQEILSANDVDFDSMSAESPSSINRPSSPAVIGRRPLEPQRSGSSPEVARPGQFPSPPAMSHSAPNPTPPFGKQRTDSGIRLKPEAGRPIGPSHLGSAAAPTAETATPTSDPAEDETKMKKRSNVVLEIINTERDYVQDLQMIREIYLKHLDREGVISKQHLNDIFSNIEQLNEVNNQVRAALPAPKLCGLSHHAI